MPQDLNLKGRDLQSLFLSKSSKVEEVPISNIDVLN